MAYKAKREKRSKHTAGHETKKLTPENGARKKMVQRKHGAMTLATNMEGLKAKACPPVSGKDAEKPELLKSFNPLKFITIRIQRLENRRSHTQFGKSRNAHKAY